MNSGNEADRFVAVVGAGPAGIYASKQLADAGVRVVLLNRDIKPGGLAEYGIYHDKHKMKEGLRKQFRQILASPDIHYFGNVTVGDNGIFTLQDLRGLGCQAILVTVGAQGTKWLGLPGEELQGVYHAKDIVYHYNLLPPFSQQAFHIGRRAALIGVGNVMVDVAHWLVRDLKIDEVIAVARRGPAEVKFTKKEMESVVANVDVTALDAEIARVTPLMLDVGQDPAQARDFILSAQARGEPATSDTVMRFEFLASPAAILDDGHGRVGGLEVEDTKLVPRNGDTSARSLGTRRVLDVDTVVFCIGDRVDEEFGLPVEWNEFVKNPEPRFTTDGVSYEAFDPAAGAPIEGVFVAGWARKASDGLVGVARKDGTAGADAVLRYLQTQPALEPAQIRRREEQLIARLAQSAAPVVRKADWQRLEAAEDAEAARQGLEAFKYGSNEEMLAAMGMAQPA
ncbi:MAG: FAD-dependent oxidoreductase [Caldilineales bacterium]